MAEWYGVWILISRLWVRLRVVPDFFMMRHGSAHLVGTYWRCLVFVSLLVSTTSVFAYFLTKCWGDVIRKKIFVLLLKLYLTRSQKTDDWVCWRKVSSLVASPRPSWNPNLYLGEMYATAVRCSWVLSTRESVIVGINPTQSVYL